MAKPVAQPDTPIRRITGQIVTATTSGESVRAYVPYPLPPKPPLALTHPDFDLIEHANRALRRLDGLATTLLAAGAARQLLGVFDADRKKISKLGRAAASPLRVHELLQRHPLTSAPRASKGSDSPYPQSMPHCRR